MFFLFFFVFVSYGTGSGDVTRRPTVDTRKWIGRQVRRHSSWCCRLLANEPSTIVRGHLSFCWPSSLTSQVSRCWRGRFFSLWLVVVVAIRRYIRWLEFISTEKVFVSSWHLSVDVPVTPLLIKALAAQETLLMKQENRKGEETTAVACVIYGTFGRGSSRA